MDKDRTAICEIISEMLDNPDECGIYPTSECFDQLEKYVEEERAKAMGWMHAEACSNLDNDIDLRTMEVPEIYARSLKELSK